MIYLINLKDIYYYLILFLEIDEHMLLFKTLIAKRDIKMKDVLYVI